MYWKLTDILEYDMTEHTMKSEKFIFAIMANSKKEAIGWFYFLYSMGIISFSDRVKLNIGDHVSECTKEEYLTFYNSVVA